MDDFNKFILAIEQFIPSERIDKDINAEVKYGSNTIEKTSIILGALRLMSQEEVTSVVKHANTHHIKLYPISTGHNWGYGSATPVIDHCVVIDLSMMNKIVDFDPVNGLLTVQPGVTTGALWHFLHQHHHPFMVPATGAGPTGSIIGNALERGFGMIPISDHCAAIMQIKAILADGSLYENVHATLAPHTQIGTRYKWGIGAYFDGLFSQSNFSIVTEMTIALRKKPSDICLCVFHADDKDLNKILDFIIEINLLVPGNLSYIQLLNRKRYAETMGITENKSYDWVLAFIIYGEPILIKPIKKMALKLAKPFAQKKMFITYSQIKKLNILPRFFTRWIEKFFNLSFQELYDKFDFFYGKPNDFVLKNFFYTKEELSKISFPLDLERDKKGIFWVAPLIPIKVESLRLFCETATNIMQQYGYTFSVTFNAFGPYCLDATIPLVFDRNNKLAITNAKRCHDALLTKLIELELIPYRLGIHSMNKIFNHATPFMQLQQKIKKALDANNILSPGRYEHSE